MKVAVIGVTGYGGAELLRLLLAHPQFSVAAVYTSSQEGQRLDEIYPHLAGVNRTLEAIDAEVIAKQTDLVFTATPSGVSSQLVPHLLEAGCRVVDLSGDFRLKETELYEHWYGYGAAPKGWVDEGVYGLTEWEREEIQDACLVANPGCYPTATLLGLAPLVQEGVVEPASIIIDAKSGVSGAGRTPSLGNHYGEVNENLKIYKVNAHQHIPEIEQMLQKWGDEEPITFSTHLVPMTRGIMATIYATVNQEMTAERLWQLYAHYYAGEPFIRLRRAGTFPATKEVTGSNYCDLGLAYDERTGRITVVSVIDNLMKGAAGQAVQNANLMCGWDEALGLNFTPIYP
ncbi:N-acetyl-gamma-glutamyl-phosphate reductase [Rubeoparvulum massiliense]|uniref:N-acetyl-gamma-glutamyl-phosphate reductase n=1 Tax=Rubeoparvulum massiliense TaxID=1631346 RepID=UPI00065E8CE5|nr:N-acetyl-gamma-glutamyl-phosphate reductase [Rubeoparvulum massiliense]